METSESHSVETNPPSRSASQALSRSDDYSDQKSGPFVRILGVLRAFVFAGIKQHQTAIDVLWLIGGLLKTKDPADSTNRVFTSKHVSDLRLICAVSFVVLFWITIGSAIVAATDSRDLIPAHHDGLLWFVDYAMAFGRPFLKGFGPAVTVFGAILAWAYQRGSARLGVVDLFACEIDTLCRMITVNDGVNRQIRRYASGPSNPASSSDTAANAIRFSSQENYFPVFEGNVKDLQTLEARVVVNITAFYTYMKAVRDSMRTLAAVTPPPNEFEHSSGASIPGGLWHDTARNMIYMLYLGLESARKAIDDLVEFEPEQAERKIVILISELTAYGFLCTQFTDPADFRRLRLELRRSAYLEEVPALRQLVTSNIAELQGRGATLENSELLRQWVAAERISPELNERLNGVRNRVCKALEPAAR